MRWQLPGAPEVPTGAARATEQWARLPPADGRTPRSVWPAPQSVSELRRSRRPSRPFFSCLPCRGADHSPASQGGSLQFVIKPFVEGAAQSRLDLFAKTLAVILRQMCVVCLPVPPDLNDGEMVGSNHVLKKVKT